MIKIEIKASKIRVKIWKGMSLKQIIDRIIKDDIYQKVRKRAAERSKVYRNRN